MGKEPVAAMCLLAVLVLLLHRRKSVKSMLEFSRRVLKMSLLANTEDRSMSSGRMLRFKIASEDWEFEAIHRLPTTRPSSKRYRSTSGTRNGDWWIGFTPRTSMPSVWTVTNSWA
jgi:hypothetical protein